ncbi:VanZ family protein [Candidatus Pelagibacter sp.]|nr:VanZ family protein [Candidatus Pelagibacter sp.]|tara:strand:- start:224 stop:625 length:402 start_codon:yes stop_codon:yes gene_type:complete
MKIKNKLSILGFHSANLVLIIFYLYPGSIFGCYLYNNCYIQPQITANFMISFNYWISSNHFYVFTILSILAIFAYQNTKKIKFLFIYLFLLSIILELFHLIIPNRGFEWSDLFGNILGLIFVIVIYKVKNKYV